MNTQIIKVYYGSDALPYKDKERTVHFPVSGSTFLGSSDTTKIRFYVNGYLADENALWISVSKRADGTQGSQFLTSGSDSDGAYKEMTLSGWYTEKKGDLYISLKGYQGGSTGYWDEETGMYVVQGVPVIRATGSIKLAINYAPVGEYPNYEDDMATFQDLVAQLGDKLNITSGIKVVDNIAQVIIGNEQEGQLFYTKATKKLYELDNGSLVVFFETYDKDTLDTKFSEKVDKLTTSGKYVYAHITAQQGEIQVGEDVINNAIPNRTSSGQLKVPTTPTDNSHATSKSYVDSGLDLKADKSTTYTKTETDTFLSSKADKSDTYTKSQVDDAIASAVSSAYKYKGSVASYSDLPSSGNEIGDVYNVEDTGDNYAWTGTAWDKLAGTVDLSDYVTDSELSTALTTKQNVINSLNKLDSDLVSDANQTNKFVTTSEKSTWNSKQDALVSGTSIKTIAGQSVLGSGAIDLSEYAKVDGNYPTLTSGQALSIYSDREISDADQACPPITFGTAGGNAEIQTGYNKFEELRGNTVKWNQCLNLTGQPTSDTPDGLTFNRDNSGLMTVSGTATASGSTGFIPSVIVSQSKPLITGHKYLLKLHLKGDIGTAKFDCSGLANTIRQDGIYTAIAGGTMYGQFLYVEGETYDISYKPEIFDITDIYGAGNEPTTIDEFNNIFPLPYYEYNAGQLLSSKSSALESIGMNQFDGELEGGSIDLTTGQDGTNSNNFRTKNYTEVIPGKEYVFEYNRDSLGGSQYIMEYDGDKNFIGFYHDYDTGKAVYQVSDNTHYIRINYYKPDSGWSTNIPSLETAEIMVRLYCNTLNVAYKPYEKQTINLPNIELRSAGSAYDVIYPSGGGKRRIEKVNIIDMINSQYRLVDSDNGSGKQIIFDTGYGYLLTHPVKAVSATTKGNILTTLYETVSNNTSYNQTASGYTRTLDNFVSIGSTGFIAIVSHAFDNLSSKQDLIDYFTSNSCYIQYELETETEITSDPFTELVKVDNYGILKFVSSQAIQVPQAYFIRYTVSLTEWLDSAYAYTDGTPDKLALKSYVDTAISQIPTGDFGFPIITAPSSTTLTNDEVAIISKGAVVLSTFLGYERLVFFPIGNESFGEKAGTVICVNGFVPEIRVYKISSQNVISLYNITDARLRIQNLAQVNGKNIPAYPSNTGTWVLKCINGKLAWVAE